MPIVTIYMDVCCLNRPFDYQDQDRIYLESEAILSIMAHCQTDEWELIASDIIDYELSRFSNSTKLQKVRALYSVATRRIHTSPEVREFSQTYCNKGIKRLDSLHLALCEVNKIDVLLTTDDKFMHAATRLNLTTKIANPVTWLMEVTTNEH